MQPTEYQDGISIIIKYKWKIVLIIGIILISVLFSYIISPLLDGIIMGVVFAYVARPLKKYIDKYSTKLSPYIATGAIVLPIFFIVGLGIIEIFSLILWVMQNQETVITILLTVLEKISLPDFIRDRTKDIILNLTSYILPIVKQLPVTFIIKSFSMFILNIIIAILLCFFLLVDGNCLVGRVVELIPEEEKEFSKRALFHLDGILSAMFIGNTYSAIAVGILSIIVFSFFGFTNVLALSALMLVAAIVPVFTGGMVIVPLAIYLYFDSGAETAISFLIVSLIIIIIPPELFIRPYLINTRSNIHPMLIILAFTGGALVGGIAGFFIAPMLLGAIVASYRAYVEIHKNKVII